MKRNVLPLTLISILSDGKFYSNKQLEKLLGISYAMINKYVKILMEWGIDVFFIPGKGYCLQEPIQFLDEALIQKQTEKGSVIVLSAINSTNQYLLDRMSTLHSGDTCIAEYQQEGRGRCGRKWFSPFGSNLYLSMYWYLKHGVTTTIGLSLVISIVIAKVFHDLGANQVQVKWPNDLYFLNRKLAGVLTELRSKKNKDNAAQIVIGAGINLTMRSVKANNEINQTWINLREAGIIIDRNKIAVKVIKELRSAMECFEKNGLSPFLSSLKKLSNFIDRPVKLVIGNKEICGISRGVDDQGALLLEQNNVIKPWVGEEVSLRNTE